MTAAWNIGSTTRPRSPGPGRVGEVDLDDVGGHRAVGEDRALRRAGRTARVHLVERIGGAHLHGRWRGRALGEAPFQRLPATGPGRSFGHVGVDPLKLRADLVDAADVVPIDDE